MYAIHLASDDEMPVGHDWSLVTEGGDWFLVYRASALDGRRGERMLEESWAAYRALEASTPPRPVLRRVV